MKNILSLLLLLVSFITNAQTDYDKVGQLHNELMVDRVKTQPALKGKDLNVNVDFVSDLLNKKGYNLSKEDINGIKSGLQEYALNKSFNQIIDDLQTKKLITSKQNEYFKLVDKECKSAENDSELSKKLISFEQNLLKTNRFTKKEKEPLLAYLKICQYSLKFLIQQQGTDNQTARISIECKNCLKTNKWKIIQSDGIGAGLGVILCLISGGNPVMCFVAITVYAAVLSNAAYVDYCVPPCN
jgi:hypothetical protein